jgi:hypothetical protein
LPVAPINSIWWKIARAIYPEPKEEVGWPDLANTVGNIYNNLPPDERARTRILRNYSEIGALYVYGYLYHLPPAIGGENSDWLRGYGDPPPQTLIVVGWNRADVDHFFNTCTLSGQITNSYHGQSFGEKYNLLAKAKNSY